MTGLHPFRAGKLMFHLCVVSEYTTDKQHKPSKHIQLSMYILILGPTLEGLTRDLCKGLSKLVPSGASNNHPP